MTAGGRSGGGATPAFGLPGQVAPKAAPTWISGSTQRGQTRSWSWQPGRGCLYGARQGWQTYVVCPWAMWEGQGHHGGWLGELRPAARHFSKGGAATADRTRFCSRPRSSPSMASAASPAASSLADLPGDLAAVIHEELAPTTWAFGNQPRRGPSRAAQRTTFSPPIPSRSPPLRIGYPRQSRSRGPSGARIRPSRRSTSFSYLRRAGSSFAGTSHGSSPLTAAPCVPRGRRPSRPTGRQGL